MSNKRSKAFEAALSIVEAEVTAEKLAEKIQPILERPIIVEKPIQPPKPTTQIIDMTNERIEKEQTLLDLQGEGVLEKLLLRSPSQNFSISLITEATRIEGSYSHFEDVLASQEEDTYVLEITNIEFKHKVRLVLTVTEPITFSHIFVKFFILNP